MIDLVTTIAVILVMAAIYMVFAAVYVEYNRKKTKMDGEDDKMKVKVTKKGEELVEEMLRIAGSEEELEKILLEINESQKSEKV